MLLMCCTSVLSPSIKALRGGVNVIDTSCNFSGGDAEVMTGQVVKHLVKEKLVARDVWRHSLSPSQP
jgi:predicted aldo/keto reductase-like oxidoreductase